MSYLRIFSNYLEKLTGINQEYILLIILSIISVLIIKLILFCLQRIFKLSNNKHGYMLYQRCRLILMIVNIIVIFILWDSYLENIITIISFISAALTLALREVIFNFFAGIYIKIKKPFLIDDRIEFHDTIGDVVSINTLDFEVLEVGDYINGEQSTGKIVNIPNSVALLYPIKNYDKNFKYIWNEITVKTILSEDVDKVKTLLYRIIKENEIINSIPDKMRKNMNNISFEQRIYFNKLEPIIYLRVVESHIEFYIRYLMHPKKGRLVENDIWTKILLLHKEGKISLYVD